MGLCFKCDEKFSPGHRCKLRQLQVLLITGKDTDREDPQEETTEAAAVQAETVEGNVDLSLNFLRGFASAKTIKLRGTIGDREVVVLVDSGASHSFISVELVRILALPSDLSVRHKIQVGNDMSFQQSGVCRGVRILIQGHWVVEDFFFV